MKKILYLMPHLSRAVMTLCICLGFRIIFVMANIQYVDSEGPDLTAELDLRWELHVLYVFV